MPASLEALFTTICEKAGCLPDDPELRQAFDILAAAHGNLIAPNNQPYAEHVLQTAAIVAEWGLSKSLVLGALLHDVLDEQGVKQPIKISQISAALGPKTANLVKEISRLGNIQSDQRQFGAYENLIKRLETTDNLNALLIKLASTLQQARTLSGFRDPETRSQRAQYLRSVYAPVATRLGMWLFKRELEDLCFQSWLPREYDLVEQWRTAVMQRKSPTLNKFADAIKNELSGVEVLLVRRHLYSLYEQFQILSGDGIDLSRIKDFLPSERAYRLVGLVDTLDDCYHLLGILHHLGIPNYNGVRDSLSAPRPNGYASLDTTVRYQKTTIEIKIRTRALDQIAISGLTCPPVYQIWLDDFERKIPQDKNLAADRDGSKHCAQFLANSLRQEGSKVKGRILVRGRDGKAFSLPTNASVLDFAYAIHTSVGDTFRSATVNGFAVPISHTLQTGDMVYIETDPTVSPKTQWMDFVHTNSARQALKKYFNLDPEQRGSQLLTRALQEKGMSLEDPDIRSRLENQTQLTHQSLSQLFQAIGKGEVNAFEVVSQLYERLEVDYWYTRIIFPAEQAQLVEGRRLDIHMAQCCMPKYPERIVGGLRRNKLHIHRYNCAKGMNYPRLIPLEWNIANPIDIEIHLHGQDRPRLVYDIAGVINNQAYSLDQFDAIATRSGQADIQVKLKMPNLLALNYLTNDLNAIESITNLEIYENGSFIPRESLTELAKANQLPVNALKLCPYNPGIPIKDFNAFFGRKKEVAQILRYLTPDENPVNLIICAQKRTGKTSLAYRVIQDIAIRRKFIPVYIDLSTYRHTDETIILEAIESKINQEAARQGFTEDETENSGADPFVRFQSKMENLSRRFLSNPKRRKRVLIVLDEFGSVLETYPSGLITERLFSALRAWSHTLPISMILIGQTKTQKRLNELMVGFTDIFVSNKLEGLAPNDARELIIKPALGDMYYNTQIIEQILDLTACYPFYIQLFCAKLFNQTIDTAQTNVTQVDLDKIIDELTGYHSENYYRHLWGNRASKDHLQVLACLACLEERSPDRGVTVEEVQRELGLPEPALQETLQELYELDTLEKTMDNDREQVYIRVPLFRRWLLRNKTCQMFSKKKSQS